MTLGCHVQMIPVVKNYRGRLVLYSCDKEINKIVARLVRAGWTFSRGRHGKLRAPGSVRFVTIPSTPSDHRTLQNLLRDVRRQCSTSTVDGTPLTQTTTSRECPA